MLLKTSELTGAALDWAVAKCEGASADRLESYIDGMREANDGNYSTDWSQGGPIIERERITMRVGTRGGRWVAFLDGARVTARMTGDTPLIAAMRCYCASKLGDTVEVPDELTN